MMATKSSQNKQLIDLDSKSCVLTEITCISLVIYTMGMIHTESTQSFFSVCNSVQPTCTPSFVEVDRTT